LRLPVLILAALFLSISALSHAGFDLSKLDSKIDLTLSDSSMADAVSAISQVAGIDVASPTEPGGLSASWNQESVREILNTLAKISGLSWHIENTVIVFRKPVAPASLPKPPKETMTPDEGMTSLLASLRDVQLFYVSRGLPLPYAELSEAQQQIVKAMLSSSNAGISDLGPVTLPAPEQVSIAFRVMPLLMVPKTSGGTGWSLRLNSMPFATLTGKAR